MATATTPGNEDAAPVSEPPTFPEVHEETEVLQFRDGSTPDIHIVSWTRTGPVSKSGANILLWIHGLGEHSGRYKTWAQRLLGTVPSLDGIATYDQRGHGLSGGTRGQSNGIDELAEDFVLRVSPRLALQFGTEANIIIGGHSLGGMVAAASAMRKDWLAPDELGTIRGVLLGAPCVKLLAPGLINKMLVPVVGLLARVPGVKRITKANGIEHGKLTHDEEMVKSYAMDERRHEMLSVALGADIISYGAGLVQRLKLAKKEDVLLKSLSTMIVHGDQDDICLLEGSQALAECSPTIELEVVKGAFHEAHNEKEEMGRRVFFEKVGGFLTKVYGSA